MESPNKSSNLFGIKFNLRNDEILQNVEEDAQLRASGS